MKFLAKPGDVYYTVVLLVTMSIWRLPSFWELLCSSNNILDEYWKLLDHAMPSSCKKLQIALVNVLQTNHLCPFCKASQATRNMFSRFQCPWNKIILNIHKPLSNKNLFLDNQNKLVLFYGIRITLPPTDIAYPPSCSCSIKALHRQTRTELKQSLQYCTAVPFDILSGAC